MRNKRQQVLANKVKMMFGLSNLETAILVKFAYLSFNNIRVSAIAI